VRRAGEERKVFQRFRRCFAPAHEERGKKVRLDVADKPSPALRFFFLSSSDTARLCFAIPKAKRKKKLFFRPQHMCARPELASVFFFLFLLFQLVYFTFFSVSVGENIKRLYITQSQVRSLTHTHGGRRRWQKSGDLRTRQENREEEFFPPFFPLSVRFFFGRLRRPDFSSTFIQLFLHLLRMFFF
jgi:hypothetical protein